jgi:hypothetical protein
MLMNSTSVAAFALCALALAGPAAAKEGSGQERVVTYDQAYFQRFAPRSALDLVRQVPGFTFEEGNADVRGFAGSAGNVVFNGARPSSKADSLATQLARIPASRVARIEIGPGDLYGSDFAGRAMVANLILTEGGGLDGTVTGRVRRTFDGRLIPSIEASGLLKRGQSSFSLAASTANDGATEEGFDRLTDIATGAELEYRAKTNRWSDRDPYVSASWTMEQGQNRSLRLNGRWSPTLFKLNQENHVTPASGPERDDRLSQRNDTDILEVGADLTRPLAGGAFKLVGLLNRRDQDSEDRYEFRSLGGATLLSGFRQRSLLERGETLGRVSWSHQALFGMTIEATGEAALNSLDADLGFYSVAAGGTETRIDLPIDEATVREKRGQLGLNVGRSLGSGFRVDAAIAWETSRLKVRGDTDADRSLSFLKPGLTLDWKGKSGWHVQLASQRTVAQLDFFDFISAAELSNDRINGGNANLQPQRSWENRLVIDRPILGTGQVRLAAGYDRISSLQDRILTEEGFDAPGNIGTGTRHFIEANIDAPLDTLGLKGVRARLFGQLQRSRVLDPSSGDKRAFSGFFPAWQWSADLRRDAGKWAYGINVGDRAPFTFFRTDQVDTSLNSGPFGTAFVEYRAGSGTTITADVENLFDTAGGIRRTLYEPNRRDGVAAVFEERQRNRHLMLGLSVKHSLGGRGPAQG